MIVSPLSVYAESIRRVRVGLDQALRRQEHSRSLELTENAPGKVILVTSALPGDGKSTLALSLARAYALAGRKTLLIDCDMRNPGIHPLLNIEPLAGLLDYLDDTAKKLDLGDILYRETQTGLEILLGAHQAHKPTDQLLTGKRFEKLIDSATRHFEIVILDSPPVEPVVDAVYLARYADVIALVIRWASTAQNSVRPAIERLTRGCEADILAVLNHSEQKGGKYSPYYK